MAGNRDPRALGPTAPLSDKRASAQRTVNMYLSPTESVGEDKQFILRSCPGASSIVTCAGELRGMCTSPDGQALFYVDGDTVYERRTGGTTTHTGTLSTTTGPVSMAYGSGGFIVIATGSGGYVVDATLNTVTLISDADYPDNANQVAFLDGYWIVNTNGAGTQDQWQISAIDDPTSWDALDFTSTDRIGDNIIAIRVSKQEIYFFGERSCEIWYNSGGADFPFSRYTQAPIDIGCMGRFAACQTTDSLAFIGRAAGGVAMLYVFDGHTPRRVSTRAVEEALSRLVYNPNNTALKLWSYQAAGSEFIGIDLADPVASDVGKLGATWIYDLNTGLWHEREQFDTGNYKQLEAIDVQMYLGLPYIGVRYWEGSITTTWRLLQLSESVYQWGSQTMRRERVWPHMIAPSHEAVRYTSMELLCTTGSGSSASVSLEISNDGGETFGTAQSISISSSDTTQRVRWFPLGQARDRVFRIRCSSNAKFNVYGAQVETG